MQAAHGKPFLTAQWRRLAMANYVLDPVVLAPHLPTGTEIDAWRGNTYVSLVGFLFLDTKVKGFPIPFHRNFEEVNLRFYVRRRTSDGWRRGVVFIKEIVPRRAIAGLARSLYNENYVTMPMRHVLQGEEISYSWKVGGSWDEISARTIGSPFLAQPGSEEEFITEHYWGYSRRRDGGCAEYKVEHPPWRLWRVEQATVRCSARQLYGNQFEACLSAEPSSVFVAEGSQVAVYPARRLDT